MKNGKTFVYLKDGCYSKDDDGKSRYFAYNRLVVRDISNVNADRVVADLMETGTPSSVILRNLMYGQYLRAIANTKPGNGERKTVPEETQNAIFAEHGSDPDFVEKVANLGIVATIAEYWQKQEKVVEAEISEEDYKVQKAEFKAKSKEVMDSPIT